MICDAREMLLASSSIFRYGEDVVLEEQHSGERRLATLVSAGQADPAASARLANVLICQKDPVKKGDDALQFPPPKAFVQTLFNNTATLCELPVIRTYCRRPVFDSDFNFCGPGWHGDSQILVHGPEVEPVLPDDLPADGPALRRLPPRLRGMLSDFCFKTDADLAGAVAAILTGMMSAAFQRRGKPVCLFDGNQPGVGKTLLARAVGLLLDGIEPHAIHFTPDDEELGKRICAGLRSDPTSVVLIDNAKVRAGTSVSSPVLEANSVAPDISLRILGQSATLTRPNDLLWVITMNDTRTSPDLVSRGLPIQLAYDGEPGDRDFHGRDPIEYVERHRTEILSELVGMVVRWSQAGRPRSHHRHRFAFWAEIIGGILNTNNLPEFLGNLREAAGAFNSDLDELAAVAEAAIESDTRGSASSRPVHTQPLNAGRMEDFFRMAGVRVPELDAAKSRQARATLIGRFLGRQVGRPVRVAVRSDVARATLRSIPGRSRQRLYQFEICWEDTDTASGDPEPTPDEPQPEAGPSEPAAAAEQEDPAGNAAGSAGNQLEW